MASFDLNTYFERVRYDGVRTPTLATLRALHLAHPLAIPFESLDVLLGNPIRLELDAIADKLVHAGRGGYCFEHNLLFAAVLRELGFEVRPLAARVQWNDPTGRINGRTHMLLRVMAEGEPYFADVGFGGLTQTGPLRAVLDRPQETPHERFRVVALGEGELQLQAEVQGDFRPLYRFDLQEQQQVDYELANHWVSTHPSSRFVQGLLAARPLHDRRYGLLNNVLTTHTRDGESHKRFLTTPEALREALTDNLGIRLPEGPALDALLTRLATTPSS